MMQYACVVQFLSALSYYYLKTTMWKRSVVMSIQSRQATHSFSKCSRTQQTICQGLHPGDTNQQTQFDLQGSLDTFAPCIS
jgi:hypothetical protein